MLSREDAMFAIGFEGNQAVVDGKAKQRYKKLSTMELAAEGLFRAAFTSALRSQDQAEFNEFARYYNRLAGTDLKSIEDFKRLFGVTIDEVKRVLVL